MSLISDALKKAQTEREKLIEGRDIPEPMKRSKLYNNKRLIFYSSVVIILLIAIIIVTIFFIPKEQPQMQARNLRKNQSSVTTPESNISKKTAAELPGEETATITKKDDIAINTRENIAISSTPNQEEKKKIDSNHQDTPSKEPQKIIISKPQVNKSKEPNKAKKSKQHSKRIINNRISKKEESQEKLEIESVLELIQKGDDLMANKKYLMAIEIYKNALKKEKSPDLYLKLYGAFKEINNNVLAIAYIEDGIKQFPNNFYLNKTAAIIYIRNKNFHKALTYTQKAIKINSEDYSVYTYLGLCYFHHGDYDQALVPLQKSLELNSDAVENYYYIGLIFDNQKEYEKALEYYNVFFKLNPDNKNFKHKEWILQRIRTLQSYLNQKGE